MYSDQFGNFETFYFELYPENDLIDLSSIVLDLSLTYYAFRDKILIFFFVCNYFLFRF